jgi:hypothetical protein
MNSYNGNGISAELAVFETPFADIPVAKESFTPSQTPEGPAYINFLQDLESPFTRTYETAGYGQQPSQASEELVQLLGELNDSEFSEALYEMSVEMEDTWTSKVSNELAMGDKFIPFALQQGREYIQPIAQETEAMIDRIAEHFSGNNLAGHSDAEIESFFSEMEFDHGKYSPAQEQFLGKIFKKVKSVVKKGVDLAKKGISAVGKLMPINLVLKKLKGLVKPLLDRVLKFAIGKLPKNLQPHAQTLAKKLLNLEASAPSATTDTAGELDALQTELDSHISQLVFSADESESEHLLMSYESSMDHIERENSHETGGLQTPSLDLARQQFINELKALQPGESPAPAIERFLPAAIIALQPVIKIALTIIGRQKVINFLAGLLAKLVGKYVPANIATPLSASIIDLGMSAIGFETHEMNRSDLAYETLANTIQETIQQMGSLDEATLNDQEAMTLHLLEAFETAAANNFPPQYIKEDLRTSVQPGVWVLKPRNGPKHLYKKFSRVFSITLDPQTVQSVASFRGLPLANFLKDKLGIDTTKPVQAKVHLYEAIAGTRLNQVSKHENLPGLNATQPYAWVQLHPLTKKAALLLLKEPKLGMDFHARHTTRRHRTQPGHRFYYLEINGARLRIPPVDHTTHRHTQNGKPGTPKPSQSGDIQGVINFVKSEIHFNYYFSEEDAKSIVEKLNKNDFLGAAQGIRQSVKKVLNDVLLKNIDSKVKIIHEALPEMYLEHVGDQEDESPIAAIAKTVGGISVGAGKAVLKSIIEKLTAKLSDVAYQSLAEFFKARAAEFRQAQAEPQDGVTVKIKWSNIPGMPAIRATINALRGKGPVGNLADLSLPSIPTPAVTITADKKFD